MRFRTEIEPVATSLAISHDTPLLLLGSCFTDEIGQRLDDDGFRTVHNPLGPLYNPCSILRCLELAAGDGNDLLLADGPRGKHALDFASRYSGQETAVRADVEKGLDGIRAILSDNPVAILTLGSAFVFRHTASGRIVGNCHKLPASDFIRERLSVEQATESLMAAVALLRQAGCRAILLTISPIRHLADGLHGNTLSKAILQLAADKAIAFSCTGFTGYFPSYEILMDDLRDYRFYASDMKHPSETAVDYIYDIFSRTYFSKETQMCAEEARRHTKASKHRSIL